MHIQYWQNSCVTIEINNVMYFTWYPRDFRWQGHSALINSYSRSLFNSKCFHKAAIVEKMSVYCDEGINVLQRVKVS